MKKNVSTLIKILISGFFLFIVLKKINFQNLTYILKNSNIFLISLSLLILIGDSFFLALRWFLILEIYLKEKKSILYIWKLTMIGLFFNMFLPTSAGGDAIKIFYLIRDDEKKLLPGISVIIDRFIGSITVLTMGAIVLFFSPVNDLKIKIFILSLTCILLFFYFFFSYRNIAQKIYNPIGKIIPDFFDKKLRFTYSLFNFYFKEKRKMFLTISLSFFLQFISIIGNFLIALGLTKSFLPLSIFFVYIPLIWTATVIPSIGGIGIREFSYVFFFKNYLGRENAFALSIINLLSIIIQSIIGCIIFLTFRGANSYKSTHS